MKINMNQLGFWKNMHSSWKKNRKSAVTDGTCLNEEILTALVQCENSGNLLLSVHLIVLICYWGGWIFILNTKFYDINKGCLHGNHMFIVTDGTLVFVTDGTRYILLLINENSMWNCILKSFLNNYFLTYLISEVY